ncbi:hypothetical protein [uncultured Methylophaga sp.]|uniref:gp53-like domain-containing protein n=1 Tax=uncultured Methylophaga sp. TaxID=285271 RepID=UPI002624B2B3|nr:hypothetical protein [uncultured Methylophaga sp.]
MDPRNYKSGAAASPPDAPGSPSTGFPTEGNPGSGVPATNPGPFWFYKVGESLRKIITTAGLTPDDGDLNLLQKAIVKLVSATNHVVRLEDVTFSPAVADGDAVYWDNSNSRYDRAIADGTDKQKMVGFADVTNSLVEAFGRSALFSGLTAGTKYYLSGSTAGAITATAPSEKVAVGLSKSGTTLFVDIDPDDAVPSATEAIEGKAEIATQSEVDTGTDDARFVTPKKIRWGFSVSLAANGYVIFPSWMSGLIFQWGLVSKTSGASVSVSLPISYPNEHFCCIPQLAGDYGSTGQEAAAAYDLTTSTFTLKSSNGGSDASCYYISIGY